MSIDGATDDLKAPTSREWLTAPLDQAIERIRGVGKIFHEDEQSSDIILRDGSRMGVYEGLERTGTMASSRTDARGNRNRRRG